MESFLVFVTACVLTAIAIAPTLDAGFVYDDHRQIEENALIRDPSLLGRALTSDVWAFKGERDEPWSAYWRPTFIAWLAANHGLFGVGHPTGWRFANVVLHGFVAGLIWWLVLQLGGGRAMAWTVAVLFSIHPVHVESVAWISGSPDILAAAFTLVCLITLLRAAAADSLPWTVLAWTAGCFALLAKESAIGLPILAAAVLWWRPAPESRPARQRIVEILRYAALPGSMAVTAYLVARVVVLGTLFGTPPVHLSPVEIGLTSIRALAFYLRQSFLPVNIAPAYPLRAAIVDESALTTLLIPTLAVAGAIAIAAAASRRSVLAAIGSACFIVCLAPSLKIDAFLPEHIVHDRYLYLAVVGPILVAAVITAGVLGRTRFGERARQMTGITAVVVLTVVMVIQSRKAAGCWTSDLRMWQCSVASDPSSGYNRAQLANALLEEGLSTEALAEAERALEISPVTTGYLVRAEVSIEEGRRRRR